MEIILILNQGPVYYLQHINVIGTMNIKEKYGINYALSYIYKH